MQSHSDKPRTYKTEGVVLRHSSSGEADRVLAIYTADYGTIHVVGRGLRRAKSRLTGHLEPLAHVAIQLMRGKGIDVVTGADTLHGHAALRNSLEGIARGLVCVEMVEAFAPEEHPNPELYRLLLDTLGLLNEGEGDKLLWHFSFHVLRVTGYMPELQQCVACNTIVQPDEHLFSLALGGVVCTGCARGGDPGGPSERGNSPLLPLSVNALKVMRYFRDHTYHDVQSLNVDGGLADELQRVLGGYIYYLLEREVHSSTFLAGLSRLLPAKA
jgi:DNA repair protein RecO (recombination protein O)